MLFRSSSVDDAVARTCLRSYSTFEGQYSGYHNYPETSQPLAWKGFAPLRLEVSSPQGSAINNNIFSCILSNINYCELSILQAGPSWKTPQGSRVAHPWVRLLGYQSFPNAPQSTTALAPITDIPNG